MSIARAAICREPFGPQGGAAATLGTSESARSGIATASWEGEPDELEPVRREVLSKLEARISHHEKQAAFHAQQELHHREQHAHRLVELETVRQHFEAFKTAALPAAGLAAEPTQPPSTKPPGPEDDRDLIGQRLVVSKLVMRVVDRLEGETFGATRVAAEVNRRYRDKLKRPVESRAVSITLRRLRDHGRLRLVREGKAAHEALYAKASRP